MRIESLFLCVLVALGCSSPPKPKDSLAPAASGETTPTGPRRARALQDGVVILEITEGPGILADSNAPPPPPGWQAPKHPFVGAICGGRRPPLCSRARDLLLASGSYGEFLEKLRAAGFVIEER